MSKSNDDTGGESDDDPDRPISLPDVDDDEYSRLTDCLNHAIDDAVTSEEEIQIKRLRDRIHEESKRHDG